MFATDSGDICTAAPRFLRTFVFKKILCRAGQNAILRYPSDRVIGLQWLVFLKIPSFLHRFCFFFCFISDKFLFLSENLLSISVVANKEVKKELMF